MNDVEYFINKFNAIPEGQWCTGQYTRLVDNTVQHCALGHCGFEGGLKRGYSNEALRLISLLGLETLIRINDGEETRIPGATPRARILNALALAAKNGGTL